MHITVSVHCRPHGWKDTATLKYLAGLAASFLGSDSIHSPHTDDLWFVCLYPASFFGNPALRCVGSQTSTDGIGARFFRFPRDLNSSLSFCFSMRRRTISCLLQLREIGLRSPMELWMVSVLIGTAGLASAVIFNFVECVRLAFQGGLRSFPHSLDQKYLVVLGWGFVVPVVWGFSARWLPAFLAISKPNVRLFRAALCLDVAGVLFGVAGSPRSGTILFAISAATIGFALRFWERPHGAAKTQGIHPSFPVFVRLSYAWLIVAGSMSVWAAFADVHGGIWGASRHALTVGFAATMVFAIGPRILPHFAGIQSIFSKRLMLLSLLCLQSGCLLRVSSEPLAYEGLVSFAWKVLPVSGMLELAGVLIFATNLALTFVIGRSAFAINKANQRAAA